MTEPTITCPNCHTEIKLTESLAAPLIAATRQQFEQQLAQKDSDIAQREQAMREKEKQLLNAKAELDEQVADKVQLQQRVEERRLFTIRMGAEMKQQTSFVCLTPAPTRTPHYSSRTSTSNDGG
jgi:hypothetical protein